MIEVSAVGMKGERYLAGIIPDGVNAALAHADEISFTDVVLCCEGKTSANYRFGLAPRTTK